jgi:hypothetical protein
MTGRAFIRLTYTLQAWAAFFGAFAIWTAWLAFTEGRLTATAIDLICAALNAFFFCAQAALRGKGGRK